MHCTGYDPNLILQQVQRPLTKTETTMRDKVESGRRLWEMGNGKYELGGAAAERDVMTTWN